MTIKKLDADTTAKIAAGEVITGPTDVIKELVENSIDAGSSKIRIYIEDGGKKKITVSDNGRGIACDDVLLAFERHATSKIGKFDDLLQLDSLGFRGEALASIAAVSKITMKTQHIDEKTGSLVRLKGHGREISRSIFDHGTSITVDDLFYNTPARLKHMGKGGELAKDIIELTEKLALSHPDISFSLTSDEKAVFKTPGDGNLLNCIYSIFGGEFGNNLSEVEYRNDPLEIRGYIGNIDYVKSNRKYQYLYVNKRYIKNSEIAKAVEEAYENTIMVNKYPVFVLNIYLPPHMMDFNVHPSKTKIKMLNESLILLLIKDGIKKAIRENSTIRRVESMSKPFVMADKDVMEDSACTEEYSYGEEKAGAIMETVQVDFQPFRTVKMQSEPNRKIETRVGRDCKADVRATEFEKCIKGNKFVGQLFNTYLLFQGEDSIFILDQHAAHERVLYEDISKKVKSGDKLTQQRIPVNLRLAPREYQILMDNRELFEHVGFEFDDFGDNTICLRGEPVFIYNTGDTGVLKDILSEIDGGGHVENLFVEEDQVIRSACRSAVKANQVLGEEEIKALIDKLVSCEYPYTCPHGRPILLQMTKRDFEKQFKRIQ